MTVAPETWSTLAEDVEEVADVGDDRVWLVVRSLA
jgi:hypothetical protein